MTATLKLINLQNPSSASPNIVLNADGSTTIPTQSTTNLAYTGTLTGGTGVINIGSGQVYKDASGNVGIGTSSPSTYGDFAVYRAKTGYSAISAVQNNAATNDGAKFSTFYQGTETASFRYYWDGSAFKGQLYSYGDLIFSIGATGGAERMRLDASGNLGLGVTPSAWGGSRTAMQFQAGAVHSITGSYMNMVQNAYDNATNYIYMYSGLGAANYRQFNGAHQWFTAPSGTAGNAITFTQAMTLTAGGELLVGTTGSTSARVRIDSSSATNATQAIAMYNSSTVELFRVRSDGAVFTGTSTSGLAACPYNNTTASAANLVIGTGGDFQRSTSSLKYKTDVQNLTHGLAEVMQLRPVTYKGKSEADGDKVFGGLIAEEVHEAGLTEFVQYAEDGSPDALNYGNMVALAFKAIQELSAQQASLKAEFDAYKAAHP